MTAPVFDNGAVSAIHTGGTAGTIAVTTNFANAFIVLLVQVGTTGAAVTTSVAGAGLTWTKYASVTNTALAFQTTDVWTAPAPTPLTAATITVTTSVTMDDMALNYLSFTGVAGFDPNGSLPATTTTGATSASLLSTISTTYAEDVVIIAAGTNFDSGPSLTSDSATTGFSSGFGSSNLGGTNWAYSELFYKTLSAPTSGSSVGMNASHADASMIVFALTSGGVALSQSFMGQII